MNAFYFELNRSLLPLLSVSAGLVQVKLAFEQSDEDLAFLMGHDTDRSVLLLHRGDVVDFALRRKCTRHFCGVTQAPSLAGRLLSGH